MSPRKASATALVVCGLSDLTAVPLLLGADDVPAAVGIGVAVLAVLTLLAAFGVGQRAGWGRPLALGTRVLDILGAVPVAAGGAGAGATSAAAVTVVLSIVTIVLVLRVDRRAVRTA